MTDVKRRIKSNKILMVCIIVCMGLCLMMLTACGEKGLGAAYEKLTKDQKDGSLTKYTYDEKTDTLTITLDRDETKPDELFDVLGGTGCKIYIQSLLRVSPNQGDAERICDAVYEINSRLKNMCNDRGFTFIDMWGEFAGEDWALREEYYYDGVHVNATAYKHWKEIIDPFVYEEFE